MKKNHPASWVPTLYFAEGLPYILVTAVSTILYNRLNISNSEMAFYTGWLNLPWVLKPLWSPYVEMVKTKYWWIISMQITITIAVALLATSIQSQSFFAFSLIAFLFIALLSATHDIAADGFYIANLNDKHQAMYVGIRSLFYRLAMITGQGVLIYIAGNLEVITGNTQTAWSYALGAVAVTFGLLTIYHIFQLPKPPKTESHSTSVSQWNILKENILSFINKPGLVAAVAFFLLYRLGEAQLTKMASPFLLDSIEEGGLGLSTSNVGVIYGTVGLICMIFGGILGGLAIARFGLKATIWWMTLAINLPDLLYVWMAYVQPSDLYLIGSLVSIEQFGYGFGFTAYMMVMIKFAEGPHQTTHYAFATGIMALGMMIPGMISGYMQSYLGYTNFFIWVTICTIPGFIATKFVKIDK